MSETTFRQPFGLLDLSTPDRMYPRFAEPTTRGSFLNRVFSVSLDNCA